MEPTTFRRPEDFRTWLEQHHDSERELWVGYYKKGSGKASMTWSESVARWFREPRAAGTRGSGIG